MLTDELKRLGDESQLAFELRLTDLIEPDPARAQELRDVVGNRGEDKDVRYAAFYALNIYLRRYKEFAELRRVLEDYGDEFEDRPTYPHLRALYLQAVPGSGAEALHCATRALEKTPDHAGVLHHYAQLLVEEEEGADAPSEDRLKKAEDALERAIALTEGGYARYFATRGRLLALQGLYASAKQAIDVAIDKEKAGIGDYAIRVGEYQSLKLSIQIREGEHRLGKVLQAVSGTQRALQDRLDTTRVESIQLLGLLGAVIAFVVTSSQIATSADSFAQGGRLFTLVGGTIVVIFSAFAFVLQPVGGWRVLRVAIGGAIGVAICAFALFFWDATS